jgi:hypothetical protein
MLILNPTVDNRYGIKKYLMLDSLNKYTESVMIKKYISHHGCYK